MGAVIAASQQSNNHEHKRGNSHGFGRASPGVELAAAGAVVASAQHDEAGMVTPRRGDPAPA